MSGQYCCLCRAKVSNIVMRRAPQNDERRRTWSEATGVSLNKNSTICEKHFKESDFEPAEGGGCKRRRLLNSAVPIGIFRFTEQIVSKSRPNTNDFSSQTEKEVVDCGIALENLRMKMKVTELERENADLRRKLMKFEALESAMNKLFTNSQIRLLANEGKRIHWSPEDVSYGICLHAAGPRAYRHLLRRGYPLPSERTLRQWSQKLDVQPGMFDFVIDLMENAIDVAEEDKICVLSFEKMQLNGANTPHSYVQVVMVQGLLKSWEQPVYFDFDTSMTVDILCDIMGKLYKAGYNVVAMVSNLGPVNSKLWNNLGVSSEQSWFTHPSNPDLKVFAFADASHLLQLVRNQFLDTGLLVKDTILTSETIEDVMHHASSSDLSVIVNFTPEDLTVRATGSQNLHSATKLLSRSTAKAIKQCQSLNLQVYEPAETADFLELMHNWFDIFSSNLSSENILSSIRPFGEALEEQRSVLDKMSLTMSVPMLPNANGCLPFQKGIIVSNNSLVQLQEYLVQQYDIHHIFTDRLKHDSLHEFFDTLRTTGMKVDIPKPLEFKYKLRKYLLSKFGFCSLQSRIEQSVDQTEET